ncbi:MAG: Mur ligase family protein [Patescibacteria group bacterium]
MQKIFKKIIDKLLAHLAKKIVKKYQPKIIGITGSVGKTSTKEAVFNVLKDKFNVRESIKNYNTEIGVPLTIIGNKSAGKNVLGWLKIWWRALSLIWGFDENYPEILILEMAADHPGDIRHLVKIAPVDIAVVTAVSETHLEFFKNIEAVKQEKQILVSSILPEAVAILNYDDDLVMDMRDKISAKVLTFGFLDGADLRAFDFSYQVDKDNNFSHLNFKINYLNEILEVDLPNALSKSHVYSFLGALAVGLVYKIDLKILIKKLQNFKPPKGRMNFINGIKHTKIIDDTYNSSPRAAVLALETLAKLYTAGKKIAVLGDMLELGQITQNAHLSLGTKVCQLGVDILVTVGERSRDIAVGAKNTGMNNERIFSFADTETAGKFVQEQMEQGDIVLVKGSQSVRLEKVVKEIMAEPLKASELLVRQEDEWLKS